MGGHRRALSLLWDLWEFTGSRKADHTVEQCALVHCDRHRRISARFTIQIEQQQQQKRRRTTFRSWKHSNETWGADGQPASEAFRVCEFLNWFWKTNRWRSRRQRRRDGRVHATHADRGRRRRGDRSTGGATNHRRRCHRGGNDANARRGRRDWKVRGTC